MSRVTDLPTAPMVRFVGGSRGALARRIASDLGDRIQVDSVPTDAFDGTPVLVVLLGPELVAEGILFADGVAAAVARHRMGTGRVVLVRAGDANWAATALADLPVVPEGEGSDEDEIVDAAVGAVTVAVEGLGRPGPVGRPPEGLPPVPSYSDDASRRAGERLDALWTLAASDPSPGIRASIEATRALLRKGARPRPGETFGQGRFRLLRALASTAAEDVWRAWDRSERRVVTVRVHLEPWTHDPRDVDQFLAAARRLGAVEQAGVARFLGADGASDGFVWQAVEHLPGGVLRERSQVRAEVFQAVLDAAGVLAGLHGSGICHGAIGPDTIGFDAAGNVRLTGFQLAVNGRSQDPLDAPERQHGRPPSPQADVHGLAMCLIALLHNGELPLWAMRSLERLVGNLSIGDRLRRSLLAATDWDPEKRPSVVEFADEVASDPDLVGDLVAHALTTGRAQSAIGHLERLLVLRPTVALDLRTQLADLYLSVDDAAAAERHLVASLRLADEPGPVLARLRAVAGRTGDHAGLVDLLRRAVRQADGSHRSSLIRAELARVHQQVLGRPELAAELWMAVLEEHRLPSLGAEAMAALVDHAATTRDVGLLERHAAPLLATSPDRPRDALRLALAWEAVGQLDRSLDCWVEVAATAPLSPEHQARVDDMRVRSGHWRDVVGSLMARTDAPDAGRQLRRAARLAADVGDRPLWAEVVSRWIEVSPEDPDALRAAADVADGGGRVADAVALRERLVPRVTDDVQAANDRLRLAQGLAALGRAEAALVHLERSDVLLRPGAVALAVRLAMALGRTAEAMAWAARWAAEAAAGPEEGRACRMLGEASWMGADLRAAGDAWRRALDVDFDDAQAAWGLARVAMGTADGVHPGWVDSRERLARWLSAVVRRDHLDAWVRHSRWGRAVSDADRGLLRLASAAAELVLASGQWTALVDGTVERGLDTEAWLREADPAGSKVDPDMASLLSTGPLDDLLGAIDPDRAREATGQAVRRPIVALVADGAVRAALFADVDALVLGAGTGEVRVSDHDSLEHGHVRLWRRGEFAYLSALKGTFTVGGRSASEWRLVAGDEVAIATTTFSVATYATEDDLPPFEVLSGVWKRAVLPPPPSAPPALGSVSLEADVEVRSGPQRGRRVAVGEPLRVGSAEGVELRLLSDDELDPVHFVVRRREQGFSVSVASPRGLLVNGRNVRGECELVGGETLMAGRTLFGFRLRAGASG